MDWLPIPLLGQDYGAGANAAAAGTAMLVSFGCGLVFYFLFAWLMFWKVFQKAGQPPAMCFIPIVNGYFLLKIAGRPGWWLILWLIPPISIVIAVLVCIDIAKKFGQGVGFAIGLFLLGFIFFPILGWGSSTYDASRT